MHHDTYGQGWSWQARQLGERSKSGAQKPQGLLCVAHRAKSKAHRQRGAVLNPYCLKSPSKDPNAHHRPPPTRRHPSARTHAHPHLCNVPPAVRAIETRRAAVRSSSSSSSGMAAGLGPGPTLPSVPGSPVPGRRLPGRRRRRRQRTQAVHAARVRCHVGVPGQGDGWRQAGGRRRLLSALVWITMPWL